MFAIYMLWFLPSHIRTHLPLCDSSPLSSLQRTENDLTITNLFEQEFSVDSFMNDYLSETDWTGRLHQKRQLAASFASCHRIAFPCLKLLEYNLNNARSTEMLSMIEKDLYTSQKHMFSTYSDAFIGPTIDVCPWLPKKSGFLHYLWDIQQKCTIETSNLAGKPEYVAVSHTWGRWKKKSCPIAVSGVESWLIPENEIFKVQQLPEILQKLPTKAQYVWFDLLCIPQDRSTRADELDNMSEIGTYSTVVLPPNFQYLLPPDYPAISALFRYFYYIVSVIPVSRKSIKSIISELVHSSTVMRPVS